MEAVVERENMWKALRREPVLRVEIPRSASGEEARGRGETMGRGYGLGEVL